MPSKKSVISQEAIAKKSPARKGPAKKGPSKLGGVTKRKTPSGTGKGKTARKSTTAGKTKPRRTGKSVPSKKQLEKLKTIADSTGSKAKKKTPSAPSSGETGKKERRKRRRMPGEAATMKMVTLQTKTGKHTQHVDNEAKFNRGVYTCARNINPEMRVGRDGASLIYQEGNDFISGIVSTAMCIALASGKNRRGSSSRKLEARHILAALSSNPDYLAKITPHPPVVSVS
jgi:hypothetical protein